MAKIGQNTKADISKKHKHHDGDTGSTEVQISLLTARINYLVDHLKKHHKDHSTRQGLLMMVGRRRKLVAYLQRENPKSWASLAKSLKLKTKS